MNTCTAATWFAAQSFNGRDEARTAERPAGAADRLVQYVAAGELIDVRLDAGDVIPSTVTHQLRTGRVVVATIVNGELAGKVMS